MLIWRIPHESRPSLFTIAACFLDGLAQWRQQEGFSAISINWGAIDSTGVAAREENIKKHLENMGIKSLPIPEALEKLEDILLIQPAQIGVMEVEWEKTKALHSSFLNDLTAKNENASLLSKERERIKSREDIIKLLKEIFGEILQMGPNPKSIETGKNLTQMGVDSLMAMEMQSSLQQKLDIEIPAMLIIKGSTLEELADFIGKALGVSIQKDDKEAEEIAGTLEKVPSKEQGSSHMHEESLQI